MTSSAPPWWALGDSAEDPDDGDAPGTGTPLFSTPWWTSALTADPLTGSIAERRRIRPAIAAAVQEDPSPAQLAALDALLAATSPSTGSGLTSREWTEVVAASDRCASYLYALHLNLIARLDTAKLTEQPASATAKDSRRPASDELAPVLRISGRAATRLVGLSRQVLDLPAAEEALASGVMTSAQFQVLADVCRRLPEGAEGDDSRRVVEGEAVKAAATLSRARLAGALEEAALGADPGFAARSMAAGIEARDVVLRPSSVPGCQQVVATVETADAARVWQVIQQVAANTKNGTTDHADDADDHEGAGAEVEETRSSAQLRADVFVSLVVGDFSLTPATIAAATGQDLPAPTPAPSPGPAPASTDDLDGEDDGAEAEDPAGPAPVSGLLPDTRRPVRIPSPEERARLSEVHVVVLADDLADDAEEPGEEPDDGPGGGPGGGGPGDPSPPPPPGRERPRPSTEHPTSAPPPVPRPRRTSATGTPSPAPGQPDQPDDPGGRTQRLAAARRARAVRRRLAGYGPFGHVPGIGRLAPQVTRAAIRAARWRRLVADNKTGVLIHRSRWTLPAPDTTRATGSSRTTAEHLAVLLEQMAAPDPADPTDPATHIEVSYRPSVLLAAHVRSRDAGCISPVCHHPARASATQIDHTTAWGPSTPTRLRGGLTEAGNLGCICVGWHQAKTHGGWDLTQPSPGTFVWTSPTGRVYHRTATPLLPDLADLLG